MVDMAAAKNMALDLVLRALMSSREFCDTKEKNWNALASLIPQTSAQQCYNRWKELQRMPQIRTQNSGTASYSTKNLCTFVKSVLHTNRDSTSDDEEVDINSVKVTGLIPDKSRNQSMGEQLQVTENSALMETKELIPQRVCNRLALSGRPRSAHSHSSNSSGGQGPNMVIHVCDESKNLKQDFQCPRDLLIQEMRYFAEYLSVDAQRWEEVDISVHCDVQIFDWLMRYVKRSLHKCKGEESKPKLEPSNVISILISSDFLKMDSLVMESIEYCHRNMSAIVSTPCNMNCINDKLVTRIAQLFTHNELSDIKDRKDKFKSKLFCKKIEQLFEENFSSPSSPENACTIFRCTACGRLLTSSSQRVLSCIINRMTIDKRGQVSYCHVRDTSWDVNEYLQSLREKVKYWKDVYWRLWGSVNVLWCHRCEEYFPLCELGHCSYHPMPAEFSATGIMGVYPCCQKKMLRFDAMGQKSGCKVRDHRVSKDFAVAPLEEMSKASGHNTGPSNPRPDNIGVHDAEAVASTNRTMGDNAATVEQCAPQQGNLSNDSGANRFLNNTVVLKDLLAHRNSVCVPFEQHPSSARCAEVDVFGVEEAALGSQLALNSDQTTKLQIADAIDPSERKQEPSSHLPPLIRRSRSRGMVQRAATREGRGRNKLSLREEEYVVDEDEDEGESEDAESDRTVPIKERPLRQRKVTSASRRDYSTFKSYKWDPQRSARWNQDAQREEDMKRMNELIVYLNKQRNPPAHDKVEKQKQKEFVGGIFSKLDYQFRVSQQAQTQLKTQTSSTQSLINQRNRRMMSKS